MSEPPLPDLPPDVVRDIHTRVSAGQPVQQIVCDYRSQPIQVEGRPVYYIEMEDVSLIVALHATRISESRVVTDSNNAR